MTDKPITSLSKNGYKIKKSSLESRLLQEIKKDLTVNPFIAGDFGNVNEKKFKLFMESPNSIYIPKFYGISKLGNPINDKLNDGKAINISFSGKMRDEQIPIVNKYMKAAKEIGGGIISLKCGGGKTVLALNIIHLLSQKTIVVVHKDFLMNQWRERIQQFLPDAKIGKIQQNTIDIEDKDIVLAMVQSLSMKEYPEDTFKDFGLAIFDECHHLGAEIFSKSMSKVASKYMLGLSATPNRKDGLRKVFEWYIGNMVYETKEKNTDYIEVNIIDYMNDNDTKYSKQELLYNGKVCLPRMINNICMCKDRNQMIYNKIEELYKIGRKIIILSDRRDFLNNTLNYCRNIAPVGLYVGGMKPFELKETESKSIILGTYSMASEGMDIPKLNTIILASPKSDVVQSVGRILREKPEKRKFHPLIIDINDTHPNLSVFNKQYQKRLKFYKKSNYDIFNINQNNEKIKIENKKYKTPHKTSDYMLSCD